VDCGGGTLFCTKAKSCRYQSCPHINGTNCTCSDK
jgi:hypothetical protein